MVFISYPRVDSAPVMNLVAALKALHVPVWIDTERNTETVRITNNIVQGLGKSALVVAWYSRAYVASRPCQWELTSTLIAAELEGALERRLLVLNPEDGPDHIRPAHVRDKVYADARTPNFAALAARIAALANMAGPPMASVRVLGPAPWLAGNVRRSSARFVGRATDLWALHEGLHWGELTIVTNAPPGHDLALVQGLGGIGKSLLAAEYALRFGAAYPGGIVWLQGTGDLGTQLRGLAGRLGLAVAGRSPDEVEGLLARHMADRQIPYLWIVDDLPAQARAADVQAWQAPSGNGHTLITTRSTQLGEPGTSVRLGVLPPVEALALLTARTPPSVEEKPLAEKIATRLGGHALALDVAGAAVKYWGYAGFLGRLNNPSRDALKLAAEFADTLPGDHSPDIATTLLDSIDRLSPAGLLVLQTAALLDPAPIPTALIDDVLAALPGGDADTGPSGRRAAEHEALAEAEAQTVSVHVLLSHTIRHHRPGPTAALRAALVARLSKWMQGADDIRTHNTLQPIIPHVRALTETVEGQEATLAGWLGRYDYVRGAYEAASVSYRKSWTARCVALGDEHPDTLTAKSNLASTLVDQGKASEARALEEEVLSVRRSVSGEEHPDTLTTMNNLASTMQAQGDLPGARALHEQVLSVQSRELGLEHTNTLATMLTLASTRRAQGDLVGARALQEQVLSVQSRELGPEHTNTLTTMNNLAVTLHALCDFVGARALQAQVLATCRLTLGDEHPGTLTAMSNLATTQATQGDSAAARALVDDALPIALRTLGAQHTLSQKLQNLNSALSSHT
jgi:hypothetical protein